MEGAAKKAAGPMWSEEFKKRIPKVQSTGTINLSWRFKEKVARYGPEAIIPNTVQQNIPAWTLFGMFFIVVPLGGSIIRERQDGMLARLLTMPTSYLTIISGKITAYVMICLVQFVLIMALGRLLLPSPRGPRPGFWIIPGGPYPHCGKRGPGRLRVRDPPGDHRQDL